MGWANRPPQNISYKIIFILTTFESVAGRVGENFRKRLVHPRAHIILFRGEEGDTLLDETVNARETNRAEIRRIRNIPIIRFHRMNTTSEIHVGDGIFVSNVSAHRNVLTLVLNSNRSLGNELTVLRGGLVHIISYIEVEGHLSN